MGFPEVYRFLEELWRHNHKEWMDANRSWYTECRNFFISWLDDLNKTLATIDPEYFDTPGKKGINRINNNLMFHPNKPIYKDHFAAGLDQRSKQGVGLKHNLLAGGYWRPESKVLRSIREAIDYNGEDLQAILYRPEFKKLFGDLYHDQPLKSAPKGFSNDHPHIDLLRHKTFGVEMTLSRKQILAPNFTDTIIEVYQEMLPFRRYLREAVSV